MRALLIALILGLAATHAHADEGMWPFDAMPFARIKQATGVAVDQAWLDRAQAAAVRLSNGCSASVVSAEGLVATNHHCVMTCVQQLSSATRNYTEIGFVIAAREEEVACPRLQAEILLRIVDVTDAVTAAAAGKTGADYVRARDAALAVAEKAECGEAAELRCQAIAFHGDSQFKVYRYRKYVDVRLAFAPEYAVAFFGGDPDNFNFPRHALDAAFLRLYENGRPVATPAHLSWNPAAPRVGEPVFVVGNPGATSRGLTVAELERRRDLHHPYTQLLRAEMRGRLVQYSANGAEQKRLAGEPLFWLENSFKNSAGEWRALLSPSFMSARVAEEQRLRDGVGRDAALRAAIGDPWAELEKVQEDYDALYVAYQQLERNAGDRSRLFTYARTLVRGAQERAKPEANRSADFAANRLERIERDLGAAVPIDPGLEALSLEFWLLKTRETLGPGDERMRALLGAESPQSLAATLAKSRLADPAVRLALWKGGLAAVKASDDPIIRLVLQTNGASERVRDQWWEKVTGPSAIAAAKIQRARYAINGDAAYPDATFSLRLSFGRIEGWRERDKAVDPVTVYGGLFDRTGPADPYVLPKRWLEAQARVNRDVVLDFVTTNDIVGGNSGSPALNARGEVIGLAFDGNIHSLGGSYGYDAAVNRSIVVSAAAVTEALVKVYGQARLAQELAAP